LKKSEQLLALIINSIPSAIIIRTLKEKAIVAVNDVFLVRHGFKREEVVGKTIEELGFTKDKAKMEGFFATVQKYGLVKNLEIDIVSPHGKPFTTLLSGVRIVWQGTNCFLTISNDITNLREYEKELVRLDNLNLMGQMAASIAHEVRNPMTSIKGFLQLFGTEAKYSDDKESLELMIEELDRVNSIITAFLSLAQKNIIDVKQHNLNDIIKNLQPLIVADAVKNDITLKVVQGDIPPVMVDKGEIRQILLNLSRNAMQAMPGGGQLTIRTFADDGGVNLVVQDSGQGIPTEVMDKIGTPFITTKKEGTGLGLAVCYSIAERLGAEITIDTSDKGTSFTVTFPVIS
jgi:PAS domain S-box-containing protein